MLIQPLSGANAANATAAAPPPQPRNIKEAACQFEGLMIEQLLKGAREGGSSGGWMGTGDDQAGSIGMEMAEQQFARALAAGGGLGLARTIAAGVAKDATNRSVAASRPGATTSRPGSGE